MAAETSSGERNPSGRALLVSIALLAASGITSAASSTFIAAQFPDRPTPRDLLFELLPFLDVAQYATDVALIVSFGLLVTYGLRQARSEIPDMISIFALMYLIRSVLMMLTPLASAHGNGALFGLLPLIQNGMFPSGHAAAALLCFLLVDAARAPGLRRALWWLAVIEWLALLLAHGHYSIDIAGGILLAYFVHHEWSSGTLFGPLKRWVQG